MKKLLAIALVLAFGITAAGCWSTPSNTNTVTDEEKAFLAEYYTPEYIEFLSRLDEETIAEFEAYEDSCDKFDLFWKTLAYADSSFYKDLDYSTIDKVISLAMIDSLDDYSAMSATSLSLGGTIVQVGVGITILSDVTNKHTVDYVHAGSGADGYFQRGDVLYSVTNTSAEFENQSLLGLPMAYLPEIIAGGEGTELTFTVLRGGEEVTFTMTKSDYTVEQCWYVDNLGGDISDDIGYIRLSSFTHGADTQFASLIRQFKADNNKALILDLRNNGGGTTTVLGNIAGYLVTDGEHSSVPLIDFDSTIDDTKITFASNNSLSNYLSMPIYVLVNANSASASEALVSAMMYYETAVVIGTTTYGKGVGQHINDGALRDDDGVQYSVSLTTGQYYVYVTPSADYPDGRMCIDGIGLTPDYALDSSEVNDFYLDRSQDATIQKAGELYDARPNK